jgi:hypothetical protein
VHQRHDSMYPLRNLGGDTGNLYIYIMHYVSESKPIFDFVFHFLPFMCNFG